MQFQGGIELDYACDNCARSLLEDWVSGGEVVTIVGIAHGQPLKVRRIGRWCSERCWRGREAEKINHYHYHAALQSDHAAHDAMLEIAGHRIRQESLTVLIELLHRILIHKQDRLSPS